MKKIAKNDKIPKKFFEQIFLTFSLFLSLHFPKSASQISPPRFVQNINIFFCLKEHLKAQGMMGLFFLIKPLFGQNTASYMIWLPFFDTFFSH